MEEEGRALTSYTAKGELKRFIEEVASSLDMPPTGITLLGGKPYVNTAGLLYKTQQDGRKVKSIRAEPVQYATKENGMRAIYKGIVEFQDGSLFENEGHASPESVKMRTLHNPDFLNMMAATRATNRAMRLATAVGLTSVEEMVEVVEGAVVEVEKAPRAKSTPPAPPAPQPSAETEGDQTLQAMFWNAVEGYDLDAQKIKARLQSTYQGEDGRIDWEKALANLTATYGPKAEVPPPAEEGE